MVRAHRLTRALGRAALVAVPVVAVAWFVVWPIVAITGRALAPDGRLHLEAVGEVLGSARVLRAAWFTLWQAAWSTVLALVVGLPAAWAVAHSPARTVRVANALALVPFALPTVVMAGAFTSVFGRQGPMAGLGWVPGWPAIVLAHVAFNAAVVIRLVGERLRALDPRLGEAAITLGASRRRAWTAVVLPLVRPAVAAAAAITFLFCVTSFGVVRILGGVGTATIETEIYRLAVEQFRLDRAAVLGLLQVLAVAAVAWASAGLGRRAAVALVPHRGPRPVAPRAARLLAAAPVLLVAGGPLVALMFDSLRVPGSWSVGAYARLADDSQVIAGSPLAALGRSLVIALAATVLAFVVGGCAALAVTRVGPRAGRVLEGAVLLPLGVSAVTLGYGYLVGLDRPVDLRASWWIVPISHAVLAVPFVVRALVPAMRSIPPALREAAAVLGASPRRVWREVDLRLLRPVLAGALGFAAAISLGEFGAASFIVRPDAPTAPVAIGRLLGRPGEANYGSALALAVVLMLATTAMVVAADRAAGGAAR